MPWADAVKLAGAFAVPLVAVAALFWGIMRASLGDIENEMASLRNEVKVVAQNVHAIDVRLARLEERIPRVN